MKAALTPEQARTLFLKKATALAGFGLKPAGAFFGHPFRVNETVIWRNYILKVESINGNVVGVRSMVGAPGWVHANTGLGTWEYNLKEGKTLDNFPWALPPFHSYEWSPGADEEHLKTYLQQMLQAPTLVEKVAAPLHDFFEQKKGPDGKIHSNHHAVLQEFFQAQVSIDSLRDDLVEEAKRKVTDKDKQKELEDFIRSLDFGKLPEQGSLIAATTCMRVIRAKSKECSSDMTTAASARRNDVYAVINATS